MHPFPVDADGYIRVSTAQALGFSAVQLQRAAKSGELRWVATGTYALPDDQTPHDRHRFEVMAATTSPAVAISHASAGVVQELSMLDADLSRIDLTSATSDVGYKRARRHVHPGPLSPDDVVQVNGVWLTRIERTAFDVARTSAAGFPGALAVFDSALRRGADYAVTNAYGGQPRTGVGVAREADRRSDGCGRTFDSVEATGESGTRAASTPPSLSANPAKTRISSTRKVLEMPASAGFARNGPTLRRSRAPRWSRWPAPRRRRSTRP